eukprot:COSAG04_NODE_4100_length_2303_cov_1.166969_4_plen_47_part_00
MQPRCQRESCEVLRATGVLEEAAEGAAVETRTLLQPAGTGGRCQQL